jgi:uncharacterized protein
VVLLGRSEKGLAEVANDIRDAGGNALTLSVDLQESNATHEVANFLEQEQLYCDILVNSAGSGLRGAATALPLDDQLAVLDLNIRVLVQLTLHFLPGMAHRRQGGVINIASVAGFLPGPYMAVYYASKNFVRTFSMALHQELRGAGVTITCVAPGPVRTGFLDSVAAKHTRLFSILAQSDPDYVAAQAWRAFMVRRRLVVPGLSAKLELLIGRLLPLFILLPLLGWLQRTGNDPCPCGSGRKYKRCCGQRKP